MCQTCCSGKAMRIWATLCALLAVGFFSLAVFLPRAINTALDDGINDAITIDVKDQEDNAKSFQTWVNPDHEDATPVYYSVYLFNLKNAPAVLAGAVPDYEEKGPYVYRKKVYKRNPQFSKNPYLQDIVSFQTQTQYTFSRERTPSALSESDIITNVNLPFANLRGPSQGSLYGRYPNDLFRYFTTQNVSSWLFGYPDPVVDNLNALYPQYVPRYQGLLGPNENILNPAQRPDVMYVGTKPDQNLIRTYVKYNAMDSLLTASGIPPTVTSTWNSGIANRVFGTDGTQFQRNLQEGQTINAFVSQLYRVVTLGNMNNERVTLKDVDLLHFTIPPIFLKNAAGFAFNADFNMFGYDGVANLTATGRTDFYVSKPHYMDADPALLGNLTGISAPNRAIHETYLNVEPMSGATMQAAKRLQLSVRLVPILAFVPNITNPAQFIPTFWGTGLPNQGTGQYMPIYWAEEYAEISDSQASSFVSTVYGAQNAAMGIYIAGEVLACVFVVLSLSLFWIGSCKSETGAGFTNASSP